MPDENNQNNDLLNIGFNDYNVMPISPTAPAMSKVDVDNFIESLTGQKINTGIISSSDGKTFFNLDGKQMIVNDGHTNRVLIGFQLNGFGTNKNYGIKVSKDGEDVLTTGSDNLIMSSAFDSFKIVDIANLSYVYQSGDVGNHVTLTYTHNLGYKPMVMGSFYTTYNDAVTMLPWTAYSYEAGSPFNGTMVAEGAINIEQITTTNVTVDIFLGLTIGVFNVGKTYYIKLYLMRETTI